jgi:hypothetical protein
MNLDNDYTVRTTASDYNSYSNDEVRSIVSSTTGTTVSNREVNDKQMDDLMSLVFGDTLDQEDSYDY